MDFSATALIIGQRAISWGELALAGAGAALFLLLLTLIMSWRAARGRAREHEAALRQARELQRQMAEMTGQMRQQAQVS